MEDEFVHVHSTVVSRHLVGCQVNCGGTCVSICSDPAGSNEILRSTITVHQS